MYAATGDDAYKEFVLTQLGRFKASAGTAERLPEQDYLTYFFALEQTGDGEYKQKVDAVMESIEWKLALMPFITAYETKYKRKEHYNDIAVMFRKKQEFSGSDLVSLIETINQMSEEIYEYYRELRDLFKVIIKEKMKNLPNSSEIMEVGYSILKACNMGVLQKEKYGDFGELLWKTILGIDSDTCAGLKEMVHAQHIILNKQEV